MRNKLLIRIANAYIYSSCNKQKKCAKYWPDADHPREFECFRGKLIVAFVKERNTADYILREFSLQQQKSEVSTRVSHASSYWRIDVTSISIPKYLIAQGPKVTKGKTNDHM